MCLVLDFGAWHFVAGIQYILPPLPPSIVQDFEINIPKLRVWKFLDPSVRYFNVKHICDDNRHFSAILKNNSNDGCPRSTVYDVIKATWASLKVRLLVIVPRPIELTVVLSHRRIACYYPELNRVNLIISA